MNFIAPRPRPTRFRRLRPPVVRATVSVVMALTFGAVTAAVTAGTPAPQDTVAGTSRTVAGPLEIPRRRSPELVAPRRHLLSPARPVGERVPTPRLDRATGSVAPAGVAAPRSDRPAVEAAPQRLPSTLPRSTPTRVRIPGIAVDSGLVGLGLQADGRMEVPAGASPAGWFTGAPTPGQLGPAILAGHVDYGGAAGVFSRLHELRRGDAVEVTRADGVTAVFRVTRVEQHAKDAFPTAAVYGDIDHAGLRLITCGGAFDRRARSYEDNIVVFAELDAGASVSG